MKTGLISGCSFFLPARVKSDQPLAKYRGVMVRIQGQGKVWRESCGGGEQQRERGGKEEAWGTVRGGWSRGGMGSCGWGRGRDEGTREGEMEERQIYKVCGSNAKWNSF
ncbi:hypothetical protein ElyMa_006142800 [Elysia marginata]|uniref:Uncharacterized protein n=1 Tax=Elysia marginata TaxID=1093978 RepID=A0AAV4GW38_9GAST|nr:hypothetical protein ElyMa_006142800 [Elysia marginata]